MISLRREETGLLVMELSEHLWPDDLELAIPVVHDVARSRQNPLLLLVVVDGDFAGGVEAGLAGVLQDQANDGQAGRFRPPTGVDGLGCRGGLLGPC